MSRPIETIRWRRVDGSGHEVCRLERHGDRWELVGTAVFVHGSVKCSLEYSVACAADWRTAGATVSGLFGEQRVRLVIEVDAHRRWYVNGARRAAVSECTDVDLGFSPSTNLLPIRRLSLAVGEEATVTAAWLSFPGFELQPLPQLYRRESERTYRYESDGGRFVRELEVNAAGFVTDYPGLWQAVESGQPGPNMTDPL